MSIGLGQSCLELVSNGCINIYCSQIPDTTEKDKIIYLVFLSSCVYSHRMIYDVPFAKYCDLDNLKLRCRVYKSQSLVPILNQINPFRSNTVRFFRVYFYDVHRSTLRPTKCSRFLTLPDQTSLCISLPTQKRATCTARLHCLHLITILFGYHFKIRVLSII